jgi:hypothetical protein
MSLRSSRVASPWAIGVTVFAAAMLIMAGGCQSFLGPIWTAIGLGVINGLLDFMRLPSQPFWAIVVAIDVLVIWALASTGQAAAARS